MERGKVENFSDADAYEDCGGGDGGEDVGFFVDERWVVDGGGAVFRGVGVSDVVARAGVGPGARLGTDDEGPVVGVAVCAGCE